jgi:hypothetical protein
MATDMNVPEFIQISFKSFENFNLKTSISFKYFFFKLQNGGEIQNGVTSYCFILSALPQLFFNRFQRINPFWTCKIKHYGIFLRPIIRNFQK